MSDFEGEKNTVCSNRAVHFSPFSFMFVCLFVTESPQWLWLAVVSVFVRPTSAPLWAVLGAYNLLTTNQGRLKLVVRTYVPIA